MVQVVLQQDLGISCTLLCPNKYKRHLSLQENNITSCTYICENLCIHCVKNGGGWSNGGENYQSKYNRRTVRKHLCKSYIKLNHSFDFYINYFFFNDYYLYMHIYTHTHSNALTYFQKKFTEVFILKVLFGSQNLFFQKAIFSKTFMIKVP